MRKLYKTDILRLSKPLNKTTGIYFLIKDSDIVEAAQSDNPIKSVHTSTAEFTRFTIIESDSKYYNDLLTTFDIQKSIVVKPKKLQQTIVQKEPIIQQTIVQKPTEQPVPTEPPAIQPVNPFYKTPGISEFYKGTKKPMVNRLSSMIKKP